ncbi:hypothetical protein Misp01_58950 [Microtetraspora sp. NBRC 13810]|uniref:SHOCT domain-containing protein n=1 Tax=Microtetraspora sp. NBRC 13810 TaxID=3030990 RepID=UPI0024A1F141|nr:SHOCT domain-containing protein [Microtetraspora sp. NBRC 13810]GLW10767.1 hypothetical protein Misp01_58950 [Microtetraspora sp. NBRC 13810]
MMRLLLVLLLITILALVVLNMARKARAAVVREPLSPPHEDPREILRRRYAAGEIDEDEYLRRMSGLSQDW